MIALDTNLLARFIVRDETVQTRAVDRLLGQEEETFFVCDIVLVELVWLLDRKYGFSRREIVTVLLSFLSRSDFLVEDEARLEGALQAFAVGGDFADHLIHQKAVEHDCSVLASFDEGFHKLYPHFVRKPTKLRGG